MIVFSNTNYSYSLFDKKQMMGLMAPKINEYQEFVSYDIGATDIRVSDFASFTIGCSFSLDTRLEG